MTVGSILQRVVRILSRAGVPQPRRDAELLLSEAVAKPREYLFSHPEASFPAARLPWLAAAVRKRRRHFPLQYLLGEQEFFGRRFRVSPAVLIPRPETEVVVEQALKTLTGFSQQRLLGIDLGTGSGCIAITLAREEPRLRIVAVDNSEAALAVAASNARRLEAGSAVWFCASDLFSGLRPGPRFHLMVANPPYVDPRKWREVDESVRRYEPKAAVFAPPDGLSIYRRILQRGPFYLAPAGRLVLELGYDVEEGVVAAASAQGWELCRRTRDLAGIVRCLEFRLAQRS